MGIIGRPELWLRRSAPRSGRGREGHTPTEGIGEGSAETPPKVSVCVFHKPAGEGHTCQPGHKVQRRHNERIRLFEIKARQQSEPERLGQVAS